MSYLHALWAASVILLITTGLGSCSQVHAGPFEETRYCTTTPARDADGSISRRADVLAEFKKIHPCPGTGKSTGACRGWRMNHTVPLACGGCDSVGNLVWMPNVLKSGPGYYPIDRWEIKVYCSPRVLVPMPEGRHRLSVTPAVPR